ncbi:MAG: hypothetical protein R2736_14040 [Solirubrobacterales bacterium]
MGFMNAVTKLARSPQGKKAIDEAKRLANDPKTKEQIENVRGKLTPKGHKPKP